MRFIIVMFSVFFLLACSESGTAPGSGTSTATITPGTTFSVADMYLQSSTLYVVFKNNTSRELPSFYADYMLQCGAKKDYGEIYFNLGAYEQYSKAFYSASQDSSGCSLTIQTIRNAYSYNGFVPWNGSYTVTTNMF